MCWAGHHCTFIDQSNETGGMNMFHAIWSDLQGAYGFEPIEKLNDIGSRRGFRVVPQPSELGSSQVRIDDQQTVERLVRLVSHACYQGLESPLARPDPRSQCNPFQYADCRHDDEISAQPIDYGLDDRLTPIRAPGRFGSRLRHAAPIGQSEAVKAEKIIEFDQVFTPRFGAVGVNHQMSSDRFRADPQ
jgi:hypothetical protein